MTFNRINLKDRFKKNAIPTAGDFAALIESQLNQDDDGITKKANEPLSIRATAAAQAAMRLYPFQQNSASDYWSFNVAGSNAVSSLDLVDGNNNTRLFIDGANGNVGVGTASPTANVKLDVNGTVKATAVGVGTAPGPGLALHVSGAATVTGNGSVMGTLGVGFTSTIAGVKLQVNGKIWGSDFETYTAKVTGKLAVNIDPNDPLVAAPLHVAGSGEFRSPSPSNTDLSVVSNGGEALLYLRSLDGVDYSPSLNLSVGSSKAYRVRLAAPNNHTLEISSNNNNAAQLSVNVYGGLTTSGNTYVGGTLSVGGWTLTASATKLVISYGATKYLALANTGTYRFEVKSPNGYFYVTSNGYGHSLAPFLLTD